MLNIKINEDFFAILLELILHFKSQKLMEIILQFYWSYLSD